ncbi:MAG TPA: twin-arginine translocase TatA/TatE family subunit [Ilumatobacteraceae bacterium]|nr:twin-arginine translocase TatA/TatE family subunit [Ilumatobacteraceae bacterium]
MFGGSQLPKLAKNLGHAQQEFKKGMAEGKAESEAPPAPATEPTATPIEKISP